MMDQLMRSSQNAARSCGNSLSRRHFRNEGKRIGGGRSRESIAHQQLATSLTQTMMEHRRQWSEDPTVQNRLTRMLDMRHPWEWYPNARENGSRTIHCHLGPTNSGKTHTAIQELRHAKSAVYCAPLRLLAMEMYERVKAMGRECALRTGEVTIGNVETAEVVCCTVEMVHLSRAYDVAILDEIQMLADEQRGWAFTQALLGLNSKSIFVCGEEAALDIVKSIAKETGDIVTHQTYERLCPLHLAPTGLGGKWENLQPGDCVVTFSRKDIFATKFLIEDRLKHRCAVVYGNLPVENRTLQAKSFNERLEGYKILVASDAIGMGLNLNIQRIIFLTLSKFSVENDTLAAKGRISPVPMNLVKQIAGRAGRFGFGNDFGVVTCFNDGDMEYLKECISSPNPTYSQAGIQPTTSFVERVSQAFPSLSLVSILIAFREIGQYGTLFRSCVPASQLQLASILEAYADRISLSDRCALSTAPVNIRDGRLVSSFEYFISHIASRSPCRLRFTLGNRLDPMSRLELVESFYRALDLYLWLASRYPDIFIERDLVMQRREHCNDLVSRCLGKMTIKEATSPASTITHHKTPTKQLYSPSILSAHTRKRSAEVDLKLLDDLLADLSKSND